MSESNVLEAIEEGRLTSAKHDLESLLKRFPNKSYYWALNCYLLYAYGKTGEAINQCKSLLAKTPSDLSSLSLLFDLHLKLGIFDGIHSIYENAIKKYPSAELIGAYFEKVVSVYDRTGIQKASMLLQKHSKSNRHHGITAAFSCYLSSKAETSEKSKALYLGLGAGIIARLQPLQTNQELFVYVKILEAQSKFHEVVENLKPLKHMELELTLLYLDALDKSESWSELYQKGCNLLFEDNFDDFDTWKYVINAAFKLNKSENDVLALIKLDSRNCHFARIYVNEVYGTDIEPAVTAYFNKFQGTPSCALDLLNLNLPQTFLDSLQQKYQQLIHLELLGSKEANALLNVSRLLHNAGVQAIQWGEISKFDNPELFDLYLINMINSLKTDFSIPLTLQHIIRLQSFIEKDPENYKLKLWILNLSTHINASTLALQTYSDLKIKMIQQDTLSFKLPLHPSPRALKELIQIFRFYLTSDTETEPFIKECFDQGLFTKAEDFLNFGYKLSNSLSRHLLTLKILRTARLLNSDYYGYFFRKAKAMKNQILSDKFKLHDNRDFDADYNLGVQIEPVAELQKERRISTEYVKLQYLKEFLITERNTDEVERLMKLFNKWINNPAYTAQLTVHERSLYNLYADIIKYSKLPGVKDKALIAKFITKNLDFNKLESQFLRQVQNPSDDFQKIIADTWELTRVVQGLITDSPINSASKTLQNELSKQQANFELNKVLLAKNLEAGLDLESAKAKLGDIENSIQLSLLKIR